MPFTDENSEKRQGAFEKCFVAFAIISVGFHSLAPSPTAERIKGAFFAFFGHRKALTQESFCPFAMGKGVKITIVNIAKQPFIGAIEIAGVNVAVALCHKLVHTMTAQTALLGFAAEEKTHKVIEVADRGVIPTDIIFHIEVESMNEKFCILPDGHIHFIFACIAKWAQAGNELKIFESLCGEGFINCVDIFGTVASENGENIKINAMLFEDFGSGNNFAVGVVALIIKAEAV